MYTLVMVTGELLFHPNMEEHRLAAPTLTRSINEIATLTFTIYPNNAMYGQIDLFTSYIKLYKNDTLVLILRPVKRKKMLAGGIEYTCEELAGVTNNLLLRPNAWGKDNLMTTRAMYAVAMYQAASSTIPAYRLEISGSGYGEHYDPEKFDASEPYAITADYSSGLWDELQNIIGGYKGEAFPVFSYREPEGNKPWMLFEGIWDPAYIERTSPTVLEYGKNIEDLYTETDVAEEFFTRLIPLGKDKKAPAAYKRDGGDEMIPLTISEATKPSGGQEDYIDIPELVAEYGVIEKTKEWKDIGDADDLYDEAVAYLQTVEQRIGDTITLSYWDLSAAGYDIADVEYLEQVRIISEPNGIDATYLVTQETVSLLDPQKKSVTLGTPKKTFTELNHSDRKKQKRTTRRLDSRVYGLENP